MRLSSQAFSPFSSRLLALTAAGFLGLLSLQADTLPTESPFLPDKSAGQASGPEGDVQLSGITAIGQTAYICLTDMTKKKSRWLAVGAKEDGFEVLSINQDKNEAVVRVNNDRRVLTLRKATTTKLTLTTPPVSRPQPGPGAQPPVPPPVSAGPQVAGPAAAPATETAAATPAGAQPPPAKPTVSPEEQEREARMLVSDLMEIGMRQRKAYEEKRRQAEAEAAKKKTN